MEKCWTEDEDNSICLLLHRIIIIITLLLLLLLQDSHHNAYFWNALLMLFWWLLFHFHAVSPPPSSPNIVIKHTLWPEDLNKEQWGGGGACRERERGQVTALQKPCRTFSAGDKRWPVRSCFCFCCFASLDNPSWPQTQAISQLASASRVLKLPWIKVLHLVDVLIWTQRKKGF